MATTGTDTTDALAATGTADVRTLCEAYQASAARDPDAISLRTPGDETTITWRDAAARVRALAAGLAAHGIGHGDTVAMMLTNRPEANLVDIAALHLGAIPFSIYNTNAPEQIAYVLGDSKASLIVTEQAFLDRVLAVRDELPTLKYVFVLEGGGAGTSDLEELIAAGAADFDFDATWRTVVPEDIATLIYTSGTTGPPKGVEVTHDNLVWTGKTWAEVTHQPPGGRLMTYLPMAHLADRVCSHYLAMLTSASITCVADAKQIVAAVGEARPTLWLGVPRIWEKLKAALEGKLTGEPDEAKRAAIAAALKDGTLKARLEDSGEPVPDELAQRWSAADEKIFGPMRDGLGIDPGAFLLSGAAPLSMDVLEFFAACGMPVNEGFGMTECAAVATMNSAEHRRLGTVGRPLPGVDARLAEDGELLIRGRLVMKGYRNLPEKTAEAKDEEGWLHTGDIAEIDDAGFVKIVDRKKEIIINAAGKNMSPANIEIALKEGTPLIGTPVTIGDGRPYNTALIVLDPDACAAFAQSNDLGDRTVAELATHDAVIAEVEAGVERANARLSRVEQIKKHTILAVEWVPGGDEVTPTMKLKRKPIAEKYREEIEALYAR